MRGLNCPGARRLLESGMRKRTSDPTEANRLRRRAENRLARQGANAKSRLQQELDIHRIELEMQNEHLRMTQMELEAGLDRYTQLFDFAPIGYATLSRDGMVLQVN